MTMLQGIRVVSFTSGVAGPRAGRILAEMGAEVLKIESRNGGLDPFRYFRKSDDGPDSGLKYNSSTRYAEVNMGVRSVTIDLRQELGRELARDLIKHSDVLLENFRPGVLEKLGLGPNDLHQINPRLVIVRSPGLGSTGPKGRFGTWGPSLMAYSGITYLWNLPENEIPVGSSSVHPDYMSSSLLPGMVIAGLMQRDRTGAGPVVDVAQIDAVVYGLGINFIESGQRGENVTPQGNARAGMAPHGIYRCQGDDSWCAVVAETDAQWKSLCAVVGRPELGTAADYASADVRVARRAEVDEIVSTWTRDRDAFEVMTTFQAAGIPAGVVLDNEQLYADPQITARDFVAVVDQPGIGDFPIAKIPIRTGPEALVPVSPAPMLGEANEYAICEILGRSPEDLEELVVSGVVN